MREFCGPSKGTRVQAQQRALPELRAGRVTALSRTHGWRKAGLLAEFLDSVPEGLTIPDRRPE